MAKENGASPRPELSIDQTEMLRVLSVAARRVTGGTVTGLALVALDLEGKLIGHHLAPQCDPHLLRGYLLEAMDEIRETWIKAEPKAPLCGPDGSLLG